MLKTNKQNQNQKANKNNKKPLDLLCNKNEVGELGFYIQRLFLPKCSLWWPILRGMTATLEEKSGYWTDNCTQGTREQCVPPPSSGEPLGVCVPCGGGGTLRLGQLLGVLARCAAPPWVPPPTAEAASLSSAHLGSVLLVLPWTSA